MSQQNKDSDGLVYLLHFSAPFHHASHYLGWTSLPVEQRIEHHRNGQGARLLQVVTAAGISFKVVRTWRGSRQLERQLKNHHNSKRHCPLCKKTGH